MKGCLWSYLYARKQIRVIRHVKQIKWKETYKSLDFWKIHSQNRFDICYKRYVFFTFLAQNVFSKTLRKFSQLRATTLNIFERLFKIISLRSKKIRVIRHVKQIIWKETYKSLDFWKIHSQNRVGEVHGYGSKIPIFEVKMFFKGS